jgi:hypothetical protein
LEDANDHLIGGCVMDFGHLVGEFIFGLGEFRENRDFKELPYRCY